MPWFFEERESIHQATVQSLCARLLSEAKERTGSRPHRVLLLPPDLTRASSGAGWITETFYQLLHEHCEVHVIPTLGQHTPHTDAENRAMFGSIPASQIHIHDWRNGVTRVGTIPSAIVAHATGGAADWEIPVDLNSMLIEQPWDLIINIGQVVPHEVLGFANHNKNYFIGLGGKETICASHMAAAVYGIERNLGQRVTPLRACFNWAEEQLLGRLPDVYLQIVMGRDSRNRWVHSGIYVGDDVETYLMAARASQRQNVTILDAPASKIVAVMQADEFRSMWVANKAIYRSRLAIANGGELLVIAPGVERFGEQPEVDMLIRKYGYGGTPRTLEHYRQQPDLREFAHAAAHLMHGSSEGRFRIRYASKSLSQADIEGVHYEYADLNDALSRYPPDVLKEGWNTLSDGERVYFIGSPSNGLWTTLP